MESTWSIPENFFLRVFWVAMVPIKALLYVTVPDCKRAKLRKLYMVTFTMSVCVDRRFLLPHGVDGNYSRYHHIFKSELRCFAKRTVCYIATGRKEVIYLTTHLTHFIYGVRHIVEDQMVYSFRLAARVLLYTSSNTYHGLCYTSRGALTDIIIRWVGRKRDEPTHLS